MVDLWSVLVLLHIELLGFWETFRVMTSFFLSLSLSAIVSIMKNDQVSLNLLQCPDCPWLCASLLFINSVHTSRIQLNPSLEALVPVFWSLNSHCHRFTSLTPTLLKMVLYNAIEELFLAESLTSEQPCFTKDYLRFLTFKNVYFCVHPLKKQPSMFL